jgi:hypothetical protein
MSLLDDAARVESLRVLSRFRTDLHRCLTARADALFELTDALLCTDGPVKTLVDLALAPEHRRSHGMLYDGLGCGRIEVDRLRVRLAGLPLPRAADGGSCWVSTSARGCVGLRRPARSGCLPRLRAGQAPAPADPGLAVLGGGRAAGRSELLDRGAGRGPPGPRRRCHRRHRLPAPRRRRPPDRGPTLAPGRPGHPGSSATPATTSPGWRSCSPTCPWSCWDGCAATGFCGYPHHRGATALAGTPPKHGPEFALDNPATWPGPQTTTTTQTTRYGTATASSWDRLHPRLTHRAEDHGKLALAHIS